MKKMFVLVFSVVLLLLFTSLVNAHFSSDPYHCQRFEKSICDADAKVSCGSGGWICEPPQGSLLSDIYCELGNPDIFQCPKGCDETTGECFGGNPNCVEGYEQCGLGLFEDPTGDVYECVSGNWQLKNVCGYGCDEISFNRAFCLQPPPPPPSEGSNLAIFLLIGGIGLIAFSLFNKKKKD